MTEGMRKRSKERWNFIKAIVILRGSNVTYSDLELWFPALWAHGRSKTFRREAMGHYLRTGQTGIGETVFSDFFFPSLTLLVFLVY